VDLRLRSRSGRFAFYGTLGWTAEVCFTGLADIVRSRDVCLRAHTTLWSFPIYGLLAPLHEPLHDRLRERAPAPLRAAMYGAGILGVEYVSGRILRRLLGEAPWDYSYARYHVDGLIRPDWFPLWAAAGLALERLEDRLRAPATSAGRPS
jgi:uncharacterized membrane protein